MKKLTAALLAILFCWNIFLTTQLMNTNETTVNNNKPVVNQNASKITTDLTKVVANAQPKTVGVSAYRANGVLMSTGSGVIYQVSGKKVTIVTNYHVIDGASSCRITFANGEEIEATKVGVDALTDIAVLKSEVDFAVEPFTLGDSSYVTVGEYVIAIGSPLGLGFQGSTTFGIISGKDRVIPVDLDKDGYDDWDSIVIQTDAAINPGNSGGALVNLANELIGITSMKISDEKVEGMGFAIPINEVIAIVGQIQEHGKVIRPILGISGYGVSDLSNMEKAYLNIDLALNSGIYVNSVVKNSAADKAGVKVGDIITKLSGVAIKNYKQFRTELYKKSVNDKVVIEIMRGQLTLTLMLY